MRETEATSPSLPSPNRRRTRTVAAIAGIASIALLAGCLSQGRDAEPVSVPAACDAAPETAASPNLESSQEHGLMNAATKHHAEQIISSFENSTTEIQYAYAEDIGDGRGITAGRAGFTSRTHDLLQVVACYDRLAENPNGRLTRYLGALSKVDGTDSTEGLEGFIDAWKETAENDAALRQAQDIIYDEWYFTPAMKQASGAQVSTAVGQLVILDTIIQHGEGEDPDGLPAIIAETAAAMDGPVNGNEVEWLQKFLSIRRAHLESADDPDTWQAWRESVSRVDALRSILDSGNLDLEPPIAWTVYGDRFSVPE